MGLLTDFYVANRKDAPKVLAGSSAKRWPRAQLKRLDTVKLASLQGIMAKHLGRAPGATESRLLTEEDAEQWVLLVPEALVTMLDEGAAVRDAVADEWALTDELKADRWTPETARCALVALADLAAKARRDRQDLLLRLSL